VNVPALPKLLIDINVVLDVVLERKAWLRDSAAVLDAISSGRATGFIAGHGVTTIYYLAASANGRAAATTAVADLLQICDAVPLTTADFHRALALGLKDFEDAVTAAAALAIGADYVVTRNEKDFKGAPVAIRSPGKILSLLPASP
jgi:predicted nucleic acid-binding protein